MKTKEKPEEKKTEEPSGRIAKIAFESLQHRAQNLRYERDDYRGVILEIRDIISDPVGIPGDALSACERILAKYPAAGVLAKPKVDRRG